MAVVQIRVQGGRRREARMPSHELGQRAKFLNLRKELATVDYMRSRAYLENSDQCCRLYGFEQADCWSSLNFYDSITCNRRTVQPLPSNRQCPSHLRLRQRRSGWPPVHSYLILWPTISGASSTCHASPPSYLPTNITMGSQRRKRTHQSILSCGYIYFCKQRCGVSSFHSVWFWGCRGADGMCLYRSVWSQHVWSMSLTTSH